MGGQEFDEPALPTENYPLTILGLMLASLMQVIDTTIANVALPHVQSSLGATTDSVTWVLTSYMIAAAVATPVTGWLAERIGARPLFIGGVAVFVVASMLCGAAQNIQQIVIFRIFQGIAGAFLPPLSQSFMLDTTKPSRHPYIMSVWSGTVMIGPIMGPVLGGWLTENWNWRFVFYINLPIGLISLFLLIAFLPNRPKTKRRFDMFGFAWLALALASIQLMLDRGNHADWFDSLEIWIYAGLAISAAWITAVHFRTTANPLLDMTLFKDRNYVIAFAVMISLSVMVFSTMALVPPMLQHLQGYTVIGTGIALMPRGVGTIISTQLGAWLMRKGVDIRFTMASGVLVSAWSLWMMAHWSLDVDMWHIVLAGFLQGLGTGVVFIPINIVAFSNLKPSQRTDASSMMNLTRSLGSSFGVSLATVTLAHNMQVSHSDLASNITAQSGGGLIDFSTIDRYQALGEAGLAMINAEVTRQASMVAYIDDFYMMFWLTIISVPLMLLIKPEKKA
ncbi:MAG: DHA2 family efflux MFS transporter permease subunit [Novosphingobium sp.]|nr:DHA2 family efflux MFS transporter permease subunit [Novosphingobium sp.]